MSQATVSVEDVLKKYMHMFRMVYGRMPSIHYIRDGWYRVNGETVHHNVVIDEIRSLQDLARRQRLRQSSRSAIQRLIDKLRGS